MKNCNEIQQKIAELEFKPITDKSLLQHLETCKDCQVYKQACDEMNQAMSQLSDFDADDGLVESTLSSIVNLQEEESNKPKRLLNTQWASALAASFMLVSLVALFPYNSISNFGLTSNDFSQIQSVSKEEKRAIKKRKDALQKKKPSKASDFDFYSVDISEEVMLKQRRTPRKRNSPRLAVNKVEESKLLGAGSVNSQVTGIDFRDEIKKGFSDGISSQIKLQAPEPIDTNISMKSEIRRDMFADTAMAFGADEGSVTTETRTKEEIDTFIKPRRKQMHDANRKPKKERQELAESVAEYEDEQDKVVLGRVVTTGSRIRASNLSADSEQPAVDNIDSKTLNNYADNFAHRYSKIISQDDESELNKVTVTGSRIRVRDLEKPSPIISIAREDSVVLTENLSITGAGKLNKAKEKRDLESKSNSSRKDIVTEQSKGIRLNSDGIGQALVSPDYVVEKNGQVEKDGLLTPMDIQIESIKPLTAAQNYLKEMSSLDNLSYQNATGYWANTYLPGDSSMRLLEAKLVDNKSLILNSSIKQNIQPFDYPENSALAVYLNSDVVKVQNQQPTRMRIQVGIQAANRQGGQRSAMNIGLVFDMSNKMPDYAKSMKALLLALLKSKQPGDNISLTVAGIAGGRLIEPKDFRHGQIQVVMNNLFSNKTPSKTSDKQSSAPVLNLNQAIKLTSEQLKINDDPSATLGSSVLMLFSASDIDNMSAIESMVHANALKGITMSTVSLGLDNHQQLKQLALAGQGHARILQTSNDAKRVIDAELLASSRAVARALRLRIRLAKGVKLIEVIDSYNLNEKQSQKVRDAELSLDKRLSKNLGIKTDRGDDEEGIQIVIPSFFAGDTHVILLDVVAINANTDTNAIADVTLRYKDLLYLRNAIAREQLSLANNSKALGPLQYNVMKNTLASKFTKSIKQASVHIRQGNQSQALNLLLDMQKLYQNMRVHIPAWNKDKEILKDEKLLQEYINVLNSVSIKDAQKINYIVDSMQYISWRKQITQTQ